MNKSVLTTLAAQKTPLEQGFLSRDSVRWLQKNIAALRKNTPFTPMALAKSIESERNDRSGIFREGQLYHFFYSPAGAQELPYYDNFPLVLVLSLDRDGFMGLNLHYLPVKIRAMLLDKMSAFAVFNGRQVEKMRVTYQLLNQISSVKEFRPCIKKYLYTNVRSNILSVQPNEWEIAIFLPTAIFRKMPLSKVQQESMDKIKKQQLNES